MSILPVPFVPPPDGPAGALPEWLRPAVEAVLRDLQRPTPLPLAVGWTDPRGDEPGYLWVAEGDEGVGGVPIWRWGDDAEIVVTVADQLQEQIFPESRGAWGEARPACPGHGHPAEARVEGSVAWWVCPDTGTLLRRVGADDDA